MSNYWSERRDFSRREFIRACALGTASLAAGSLLESCATAGRRRSQYGAAQLRLPLNRGWLFGGRFKAGAMEPDFNDAAFAGVTLPHCVSQLSWRNWDPAAWEHVWIYRRHFSLPDGVQDRRVFLHFDGVMVGATPVINGHAFPKHLGGYLPFGDEVTGWLRRHENVLALAVDSRWSSVPPEGSPKGPKSIDYLEPGGIHRPVELRVVPRIFIRDVFAKPANVLEPGRRIEVTCTIDAAFIPKKWLRLEVKMLDQGRFVTSVVKNVKLQRSGETKALLTLLDFGNVKLWEPDAPELYDLEVTLYEGNEPLHEYRLRTGLRDARFETDGFFLNGRRFRFFGLDRHELFPYVGFAMPRRVMRRDAEILRREFNCNAVRCSHYPQSEAFLDACDELGLMVWEETPGWQFLGDAAWKDLVVRDVENMVRRDRNHPAVIIWGVRVNESHNDPALYLRTKAAANSLDGSRPTSGSMTAHSTKGWEQEVFAFDDYHAAPDGSVAIRPPLPGVPYMLAETVGQFSYAAKRGFNNKYRRAGDLHLQTQQALYHAQAHSRAAGFPRMAGVIAWCAYDYGSLMNAWDAVKCPGVADVFRVPKLGASFYQAQGDPKIRPVIAPDFYWDFGPRSPSGPGKRAAIFSNCDRLELFINGRPHGTVHPDRENFPHVNHAPFFADLELDGAGHPELRIDGYVGNTLALSRSFSSDPAQDRLWLRADDTELFADGSDATRLVFFVGDRFGAPRAFAGGDVVLDLAGPGEIVGDNPFDLGPSGGVGAVWIKTVPNRFGQITAKAAHASLGEKSVTINVQPAATWEKPE